MAGGLIDYNGYQIASGALDDNVLNLLSQRGLLQDPMMSGPASMAPMAPTPGPVVPSNPSSVAGMAIDALPSVESGGSPNPFMGYEMRALNAQTGDRGFRPSYAEAQSSADSLSQPVAPVAPVGSGVLAPQPSVEQTPSSVPSVPAAGESAQAPSRYDPYADILAGRVGQARAQQRGFDKEIGARQDLQDQSAQAIDSLKAIEQRKQEATAELESQRNEIAKELKDSKINNYWDTKSGSQKALAIVALALGGAGASLTGGPNNALQIISQDINNDLETQKANLNKKKGDYDVASNLLAQAEKKFGDQKLAELEVQSLRRQQFNDQLDLIGSQVKGEEQKAKIQELKGLNTLEMEKYKDEALKRKQELLKGAIELRSPKKDSPAQKAIDSAFGKTYEEYFLKGKIEDVKSNINKLDEVIYNLENYNVTGPGIGATPDALNKLFNERALDTRAAIESIIQRDLRETLGAQFTEKEGENLIKRGYDPSLSEEINLKRVRRLQNAMKNALKAKEDAARYYEQYGTLAGYQGTKLNEIRSADQFLNTFGGPADGRVEGKASNQIQQLKQQYQQRLQANPNDQEAAAALQKIQARGF